MSTETERITIGDILNDPRQIRIELARPDRDEVTLLLATGEYEIVTPEEAAQRLARTELVNGRQRPILVADDLNPRQAKAIHERACEIRAASERETP